MDKTSARYLLTSLIERIDRDQIGTVSTPEREALGLALQLLSEGTGGSASSTNSNGMPAPAQIPTIQPPPLPSVSLAMESVARNESENPELILCLDFGTALSKAFASTAAGDHMDLELGKAAGGSGYTLPSSVFIGDDGKVYFGHEAIEKSRGLVDSGRERLDSIKSWLSNRQDGDLDDESCLLERSFNPTPYKVTEGDLIRIFLAYLTDMALTSLAEWTIEEKNVGRYVHRRYARPCWPTAEHEKWADRLMRAWLAEAQILADTFHGKWQGGIHVAEIKSAIASVKTLETLPKYLIGAGVPEPVAVAAGALADGEDKRELFMVVDVGAGTTDFGLFLIREIADEAFSRVFEIQDSIRALMKAGDRVDALLRMFIQKKQSIDAQDPQGRLVVANLRRQIRDLKEQLFQNGRVEYVLSDSTVGEVNIEEFLAAPEVVSFATDVEQAFCACLENVDESWLRLLEKADLKVVLTGGSSKLPMVQGLGAGVVEIKGHKILRKGIDPTPGWIEDQAPELLPIYPQLAVAIGGSARDVPETVEGPDVFIGGGGKTQYVAGNLQVTGS